MPISVINTICAVVRFFPKPLGGDDESNYVMAGSLE